MYGWGTVSLCIIAANENGDSLLANHIRPSFLAKVLQYPHTIHVSVE